MALGYALNHPLNVKNRVENAISRIMETAEAITKNNPDRTTEEVQMLNIWFSLSKIAYYRDYQFKNPIALAAAVEYSFLNALQDAVTKKSIAQKYNISVATLSKYEDELYSFIPDEYL